MFWKNAIGNCYTPCPPHKQFKEEKEKLEKKYEPSCVDRYLYSKQTLLVQSSILIVFFRTLKKKIQDSSLVHVYFKNLGVTKFTKDRLFGWADLICKMMMPQFREYSKHVQCSMEGGILGIGSKYNDPSWLFAINHRNCGTLLIVKTSAQLNTILT